VNRQLGVLAFLAGWAVMRRFRHQDSFSFDGKTALITGGSRGLGLVLARDLAAAGARVTICGRDPAALQRAEEALRRIGATVVAVPADVADRDSVRSLIQTVTRRLGPIDVLVNNAGVIEVGPAETMAVADYEEAMSVNFWGMVYPTLQALPSMRQRGGGRIINITSIGGKLGVPHLLPYSASKFAALGFSQGLRAEVAADGVTVTTAIPGLMRTGSPRNAIVRGKHRAEYAWFSIADSLPLMSMNAERAARQIVDALRFGDADRVLSLPARLGATMHGVAPGLTADLLGLVNRFLPAARGPGRQSPVGAGAIKGEASTSAVAPSVLTTLTDRAAERNNQTSGQTP
jgi:NAD(P)-dependent dehydrogenase (short-subunit alcohol dehydrogenase family)